MTEKELSQAGDVAFRDPRVQQHLKGKPYFVSGSGMWLSREPPATHPVLDIRFVPQPDVPPPVVEQEWLYRKGGQEVTRRAKVAGVYGIYVTVDPEAQKVIAILPYFYD